MHEFQKIIEAYEAVDFSQRRAALATVMRVEGSSYRRPGARMLMTDDGRWTGAISGGCLEGDALRRARQAILSGSPSVVIYDTMDDREANALGVGLGCNGIIDVLIEPIDPADPYNPVEMLRAALHFQEVTALATVFTIHSLLPTERTPVKVGDRLVLDGEGLVRNAIGHADLSEQIQTDAREALLTEKSSVRLFSVENLQVEVLVEVIRPSIHLIIFGGGYDAVPVANLARQVDWRVTITDDCVAHLSPKRFPETCTVLHAPRVEVLRQLPITRYTAAVLMSHNYRYDLAVLRQLIQSDIRYIGLLGPRKRGDKLLQELASEGMSLAPERLQCLHSPVGLDIGAETPEEIALSIIAEVKASFAARPGGFLKQKNGPIHQREAFPRLSYTAVTYAE